MSIESWAKGIGLAIALASFVVSAAAAVLNWRRQKREATLKAWNEWSDGTTADHAALLRMLGPSRMKKSQARAIIDDQPIPGLASPQENPQLVLSRYLNGLERLAVGVEVGVYDLKTLAGLGATRICRAYWRFSPYIEYRRAASDPTRAQSGAFVSLGRVAIRLEPYADMDRIRALTQEDSEEDDAEEN